MGAGGSTTNVKGRDELISAVKTKNIVALNNAVTQFKPSPAVLNSLLHLAVQVSNAAMMSRLVELGADVASIVEDPFTAAIGAFTGGKGTTLLHKASLYANVEVFKLILDKYPKLNVNAICTLTRLTEAPVEGVTPLYCLIVATAFKTEDDRTACVNMILEKGANLEATFQPENNTVFLLAVRPCVRSIAASRCNLKHTDKLGKNAFHKFAEGHAALTAHYLANHIRDLRDIYQYFDGQAVVGHMFVKLGMDVNTPDASGNSVYHAACEKWSHDLFGMPMKLSYTDHIETFKLTATYRFFSNPDTKTNFAQKNKAGHTGDEIIQKGIGYLKANKEQEMKTQPKKR